MNKKSRRILKRKNRKSLRKRGGAAMNTTSNANTKDEQRRGYAATLLLRQLKYPDPRVTLPPNEVKDLANKFEPEEVRLIMLGSATTESGELPRFWANEILSKYQGLSLDRLTL